MYNTVVYTGTDVIVWGGGQTWDTWLNDGAKYNISSGNWTAISDEDAPAGRWCHTAVWTGTEMIVWGGHADGADERSDGGAYDPVADTWRSLSTSGAPAGRIEPTAVWTGTEMIIFGGLAVDDYLGMNEAWSSFGVGARYNPTSDSWSAMSTTGAASSRTAHTAVWTGNEMLIWGGRYLSYPPDEVFLNTGARYNPASDSWTAITTTGAPAARVSHAAAWTGTRMIIWGGYSDPSPVEENTGSEYSPYGNCSAWSATTTTGAPAARFFGGPDAAIWTSAGMFIYGGWDYPYTLNTTALYKRN